MTLTARRVLLSVGAVILVLVTLTALGTGLPSAAREEPPAKPAGVVGDLSVGGLSEVPELEPPPTNEMRLTVPDMAHVRKVPVKTAAGDETEVLDAGLLHLRGTGFPWQEGANVYIAGHRVGWPGTRSNLVFWDLGGLEKGDPVVLTDSSGREYRYRVYEQREVSPGKVSVTHPVPGRSVVTLQTCTLPDYSRRIIVRAELEAAG